MILEMSGIFQKMSDKSALFPTLVWARLADLVGAWGGVGVFVVLADFSPTTCDTMSYFDMLFNFMYEMQKCPFQIHPNSFNNL